MRRPSYRAYGELAASGVPTIGPRESIQGRLEEIFGRTIDPGLYGLSVVPRGDARSWAYVSIVDNRTGDPTNLW